MKVTPMSIVTVAWIDKDKKPVCTDCGPGANLVRINGRKPGPGVQKTIWRCLACSRYVFVYAKAM